MATVGVRSGSASLTATLGQPLSYAVSRTAANTETRSLRLDKLGVTGSSPVPPTSRKPRYGGVFHWSWRQSASRPSLLWLQSGSVHQTKRPELDRVASRTPRTLPAIRPRVERKYAADVDDAKAPRPCDTSTGTAGARRFARRPEQTPAASRSRLARTNGVYGSGAVRPAPSSRFRHEKAHHHCSCQIERWRKLRAALN